MRKVNFHSSCCWSLAGYDLDERTTLCSSWLQSTLTPQGIDIKSANIHQRACRYDFNEAVVFKRFGCLLLMWKRSVGVCVCGCFHPLSSMHKHSITCIHPPPPPASLAALSEVQPEVCPTRQFIPMMSVSSKPEQLLRELAPRLAFRQKWNIVVVELFPNTHMIHTHSVRFPRMPLCMPHCAEVLTLSNIVSVDYSSFHWGKLLQCVSVCAHACVCAVLIAQTLMACFASPTVKWALATQTCILHSCTTKICWDFWHLVFGSVFEVSSRVIFWAVS